MLLNDVFPSKYVKAADLKGREATVVISGVEIEKIGEDRKLVVYFQGKDKGLVTNKTNANRISLMYGEDTDEWIGKEIVLGTDFVDFQGKTVEAIRIKPPAKRGAEPKPQRQHVVTDRSNYQLSTTRVADPIEEDTSAPTRPVADSEIPF
jgi:hypothetical protein